MNRFFSFLEKNINVSYAQSGEDRIISFIFDWIKIKSPTYLDIGAHHSSWLSNTYLFYKKGSSGVCLEPDPSLFSEIKKKRKRDICLNIGVSCSSQKMADFYVMTSKTLNTFSKEDAIRCQETQNFGKQKIEKVIQVPLCTVNDLMKEYFANGVNLVSVDVEGLDFEIIKSFDFKQYQPEVFCIETLRYVENGVLQKNIELIRYMEKQNYSVYGETYINTIFVSKKVSDLLK